MCSSDLFWSVAVTSDWIIGASLYEAHAFRYRPTLEDPPEPPSCAFLHGGKWEARTTMLPTDVDNPAIGSIDISPSGKRLVAGDDRRDKVYIFERSAGVWSHVASLDPDPSDASVGGAVSIGGPDLDGASIIAAGSRVFRETASGWRQIAVLPETNGSRGVTADQILVGDVLDDEAAADAGAIRVFGMEPACFGE